MEKALNLGQKVLFDLHIGPNSPRVKSKIMLSFAAKPYGMQFPSQEDILQARKRIKPFIHHTPVMRSIAINEIAGADLHFKCENFQKVGAFKARGAFNAVLSLSDEAKAKGVATHSSGNHAQALALAAQQQGIPAYIVMPTTAPEVKKKAVLGYGAEVIPCAPTLQAREEGLAQVVQKTGATFIPPFDHDDVIGGQASCVLELLEDVPDLDAVIAPVGGGGLVSGTALSLHYFAPHISMYAGEPEGADDAYRSMEKGELIPSLKPNTIADGLLTSLSPRTFAIISNHVKGIITVSDEEIIAAMRLIWERMKIIIEPSCAVPFAALLKQKDTFQDRKVGIILTGGNVDLGKLPF